MDKVVYLDNSATTPVKKEVLDAMIPYFTENFGNASSIYKTGRKAKEALEEAREKVAKALGAESNEIYFTGSGSEADNWAIKAVAEANKEKGKHIISTAIEHHAVLHTLESLEKQGYSVTYLPVDSDGLVSLDDLKAAIKEDTILITVMSANNEIGTIQPIEEIGKIAKENNIIFHTDAVQAVGMINIDVHAQNIDMLSLSAHKFGGPKGVGALYVRKGIKLLSFIHGGGQERSRRAGTENVAGIVGLAKAIELATENLDEKTAKIRALREKLITGIEEKIPYIKPLCARAGQCPAPTIISAFAIGQPLTGRSGCFLGCRRGL